APRADWEGRGPRSRRRCDGRRASLVARALVAPARRQHPEPVPWPGRVGVVRLVPGVALPERGGPPLDACDVRLEELRLAPTAIHYRPRAVRIPRQAGQ